MNDYVTDFLPDESTINDFMNDSLPGGAPAIENREHGSNSSIPGQNSLALRSDGRKTIELDQQGLQDRLEYLDRILAVSQAVMESTEIQVRKNPENIRAAADLNIGHTITIRMAIKELADDIGLKMTQLKFVRGHLPEFQLELQKGFPLTKVTEKGEPLEPEALNEKLEWDIYCGRAVKIPEHDKPKTTNLVAEPKSIPDTLNKTSSTPRNDATTKTTAVQPSHQTKTPVVADNKTARWDKFRNRKDVYYVLEATKEEKNESAKKSKTITQGHIVPDFAITEEHGKPLPQDKMAWKCKSLHIVRDGAGLDAYMASTYKSCVLCETSRGKDAKLNGITMDFGFPSKMAVLQINREVKRDGTTLVWAGAVKHTRVKNKAGANITLLRGDVIREDLDKIPRRQILGKYPADLQDDDLDILKPKKRIRLSTGNEDVSEAADSIPGGLDVFLV